MLMALGMSGAAATEMAAQTGRTLSADEIKAALAIQRRDMPADRIALIQRALPRSLDEFQRVRELEIDDAVGLPAIFRPGRD